MAENSNEIDEIHIELLDAIYHERAVYPILERFKLSREERKKLLQKKFEVFYEGRCLYTPLMLAAAKGDSRLVETLLREELVDIEQTGTAQVGTVNRPGQIHQHYNRSVYPLLSRFRLHCPVVPFSF